MEEIKNDEIIYKLIKFDNDITYRQLKNSIWEYKFSEYDSVYIHNAPTANCQVFSVGNFGKLLLKKDFLDHLKIIQSVVKKNLLLVDISIHYSTEKQKIIEEIFKDNIVFKQCYKNTESNNRMTMYLLNTKFLNKKEEEKEDVI